MLLSSMTSQPTQTHSTGYAHRNGANTMLLSFVTHNLQKSLQLRFQTDMCRREGLSGVKRFVERSVAAAASSQSEQTVCP